MFPVNFQFSVNTVCHQMADWTFFPFGKEQIQRLITVTGKVICWVPCIGYHPDPLFFYKNRNWSVSYEWQPNVKTRSIWPSEMSPLILWGALAVLQNTVHLKQQRIRVDILSNSKTHASSFKSASKTRHCSEMQWLTSVRFIQISK